MLLNMVMFKVTICNIGKMNINMTDKIEKKESSELTTKSDQLVGVDNIEHLIKIIRGQQVMLDRDLATLYGVETKRLNEQVKRNIKRFHVSIDQGRKLKQSGIERLTDIVIEKKSKKITKVRIKMNNVWYIYCGGVYFLLVVHLFSFS